MRLRAILSLLILFTLHNYANSTCSKSAGKCSRPKPTNDSGSTNVDTTPPDSKQQNSQYESAEDKDGILVLTDSNFEENIRNFKLVMVKFYAPWCGICKTLAPKYTSTVDVLSSAGLHNIRLAKLDAEANKKLANKYKIKGYPTFMWFMNGDLEQPSLFDAEYSLNSFSDEIVKRARVLSGNLVTGISTEEDFQTFKSNAKISVVGFITEDTSGFLKTAGESLEPFGLVSDARLIEKLGYKEGDVSLFKYFDAPEVKWDRTAESDLLKFLKNARRPLVFENDDQDQNPFDTGHSAQLMMFYSKSSPGAEGHMSTLTNIASKYTDPLVAIYVNTDSDHGKNVIDFLGTKTRLDTVPFVVLIKYGSRGAEFFRQPTKDLSDNGISAFVDGVLDGSINRYLNSGEAPADNTKSVRVVVSKTWHEEVGQTPAAAFVKVYAPWCPHCKKLAPVWKRLGDVFRENDEVKIAKLDAAENEIDGIDFEKVPTIFWKPAGSESKIVEYKGSLRLDDMVAFIKSGGHIVKKKKASEENYSYGNSQNSNEQIDDRDDSHRGQRHDPSEGQFDDYDHVDGEDDREDEQESGDRGRRRHAEL